MKKLYSNNLVKAVAFGSTMAALLSSVSPVFSANNAITEQTIHSTSNLNVVYAKGSDSSPILSDDDNYCALAGDGLTSSDGGSIEALMGSGTNIMPDVFSIYAFATDCKSPAVGNDLKAFSVNNAAVKVRKARAISVSSTGGFAAGDGASAQGNYSVALGNTASAQGAYSVALGSGALAKVDYGIAIGRLAEAKERGAIAIGSIDAADSGTNPGMTRALGEDAIAIGTNTYTDKFHAVAIGAGAQATVVDGVAVGAASISNVAKYTFGYDPSLSGQTTDTDIAWRSTAGAFSVGDTDADSEITRQIIGVAAGTNDTDAVNVAQLKALEKLIAGEWELSVNGETATAVKAGSIVNFSSGSNNNINITKNENNQILLELNDTITLATSITVGNNSLTTDGLKITGGPMVLVAGINAGNKKITGLANGTAGTDAVNFAQLEAVKNVVEAGWQLSINNENPITIGPNGRVNLESFFNKDTQTENDRNIIIAKDNSNNITFDLAEHIQVGRVTTGLSSISYAGFMIKGGPRMTVGGIYGDFKAISAVGDGVLDNDAVNLSQLKGVKQELKDLIAGSMGDSGGGNNIVEYHEEGDEGESYISIGAKKDSAIINIENKDKKSRKISGVADGTLSKTSTDAVNGSQLFKVNTEITELVEDFNDLQQGVFKIAKNTSSYLGGGANVLDGVLPTYIIQNKEYHDIGSAFEGVDTSITDLYKQINGVASNNLVQQKGDNVITIGEATGGTEINISNKDKNPRKISGVMGGKLTADSTDAVNGAQLWETNNRINGVEKDVQHLGNRVDNILDTIGDIGDIVEGAVSYDVNEDGEKTNKITLAGGDESEPVLIDNLADGSIKKGSKEAVNGGQLHDYTEQQMKIALEDAKKYTDQRVNNIVVDAIDDAVEKSKQYTDMRFDVLNYGIENARKEARQAAAIGLAVSNLRYNDTPGKLSIAFGTGIWRSQSAFAFGAGYTSENGDIKSNLSLTSSGGHWGIGAGFNFTLN
ncbi:YadA-like family protein [Bartonella sp. CB74]|uniref:YadA-like family protein n=1 Tax=Bartonella sp. CB74 TaxID=3113620 RepID=UPI002F969672